VGLKQELPTDVVNTPIRPTVTDLDHAGGDTGSMQAFASLRDVNVVLDGPVGCHVMPAVAVINYTDSVPYLQNVTCTELSENEVTIAGTLGALKTKVAAAKSEGRQVIIVSTPVSELIGAAWTTDQEHIPGSPIFFNSQSLDDDEWRARDRALLFLWQNRDHFVPPAGAAPRSKPLKPSVNIIGPTYGCFNSYSDLAEMKRLMAGIGAEINLIYPFEAASYDTTALSDADASIVMYPEFGISLAREIGKPVLHAPYGLEGTTTFLKALGEHLGLQAEVKAFIDREKCTTLAAWQDIWRSTHSDFFANAPIAIIAPPSVKGGLERYLGDELGLPIAYSANRTGPESAPSEKVREALKDASPSPMVVFGSINERMIIAQEKLPSRYIQVSFPGAVVRRATGTPHIGYAGAVWLLQLVCDVLFDTLFMNLPTSYAPPQKATVPTSELMRDAHEIVTASGKGRNAVIEWTDEAKELADKTVKRAPFFVRVSVTKKLRAEAERLARERTGIVDRSIIEELAAQYSPGR
jgi:chlorophyllide a reductase subunit Z